VYCLEALCASSIDCNNDPEEYEVRTTNRRNQIRMSLPDVKSKGCRMLPLMEIRTRLRICELLLLYTENREDAKFHLDRVVCEICSISLNFVVLTIHIIIAKAFH